MPNALIVLAEGFEEIEALGTADILKRVGFGVTTAGWQVKKVCGAHQITVEADATLGEARMGNFDVLILPGGMPGAVNCLNDEQVLATVRHFQEKGKIVAAICAAPIVLAKCGLLKDGKFTMYPSPAFDKYLNGLKPNSKPAFREGNIITGRGPGAVADFCRAIAETLGMKAEFKRVAKEMLLD